MYMPKAFEESDPHILAELMRAFSFALIVTNGDDGPFGTHVPLHLDTEGERPTLFGHLARANGHWQAFDGETQALVVFQGPHAYISPSWYESPAMVPTWNYAVVHAHGRPRVIEDVAGAADVLRRLVGDYESDATGNWSMDSLPDTLIAAQLKGIVAFEIPIERLEGKWKMSQNRMPEDAQGAQAGLAGLGGEENAAVARIMQDRLKARG
jgi:transcriptional regulator